MANVTLYCKDEDKPTIERAAKLLEFHENKSISAYMVEKAKAIVKKYDKR